jgi:PilZ domain
MVPVPQLQSAPPHERRRYRRYPVKLSVRYRLYRDPTVWEEGLGATRDLSSEGVSFRADRDLPVGAEVELRIGWPVKINGAPNLSAVISGRILRCNRNEIAVAILQSEFQLDRPFAAD